MNFDDLKNLDLQAINDIDFREAGNWPVAGQAFAIALVFVIIIGVGYWYSIKDQYGSLDKARQQEIHLKQKVKYKAGKAANLAKLNTQLKEMQAKFGTLLRQLPGKTEVDSLLRDISKTAQIDGLHQQLFQPSDEIKKDFYAEKPIKMIVTGRYHQLAGFVSDVAALPRIVTLHNISIKPQKESAKGKSNGLTMSLTAKIYRYLEKNGDQQYDHHE